MAKSKKPEKINLGSTRDILKLVGYDISRSEISTWSQLEINDVFQWAGAIHFNAGDCHVIVPPKPLILKLYKTRTEIRMGYK